ncbi:MAG: hypothetical protein EOO28_00870 [Comamonadaceae bacterium]|nr:MAG: hypothetical protein EOO28_00870 [Comamonadaceae bacterium]
MPNSPLPPYVVTLVDAPELNADQRAAAELRFRMALEFALGGPEMVLPTLQAWQLAMSLSESQTDADADADADAQKADPAEPGDDTESGGEAELEVIALWESAESDALIAALRPFDKDMGDARFEIAPRPETSLGWP